MSRLSEILGVKEGQEFIYGREDIVYKVDEEFLYQRTDKRWIISKGTLIYLMIKNPDKISPIHQLIIVSSLHEKLKSKAKAEGISVNELANSILQGALAERGVTRNGEIDRAWL